MAGRKYPGREETETGNWGIIERKGCMWRSRGCGDERAKGDLPGERQSARERAPEQG